MKLIPYGSFFQPCRTWLCALTCLFLWLPGCKPTEKSADQAATSSGGDGMVTLYTVNEPLRYMAERLVAASWAKVVLPIPEDVADPAFWEPGAEQISAYQQADLILLNGADYARWVENVSLPVSRIVDTSQGFKDRLIFEEGAVTHQHGPEGEHSHEGAASTIWLDFELAQLQARSIYEALSARWSEHESQLRENFNGLLADLKSLDESMKTLQSSLGDTPMLGSHPVYQYLARAYALNIHALHWEPDVTPDPEEWQALDAYLKTTPTHGMLWEDTPNAEIQQRLEDRNIQWFVFRPQGGKPAEGDFLSIMKANIESLRRFIE